MLEERIRGLLQRYYSSLEEHATQEGVPKIQVDEIASRVAVFYEKVRNIVDYQEEHLFRKKFIDRVLNRRLILHADGNIAEPLIKEIIRSGHLPNNTIPETKIPEVQRLVSNLRCLLKRTENLEGRERKNLSEWLIKITGSAIEETLFPPRKDYMLSELMFVTLREHLMVTGQKLTEDEINSQLFIGIQRALLRVDINQLYYRLIKFVYPNWDTMREDECIAISRELPEMKKNIEEIMESPYAPAFFKFCNHYNTVFYVLGDVIDGSSTFEDAEKILNDPEQSDEHVRFSYQRRFRREKTRLNRLAFFSVVSFFLSKIAIALALEIPIEMRLTHDFSIVNTLINIAFPPLLMLIIVMSIKMPSSRNLDLVIGEVAKAIDKERPKKYIIHIPHTRASIGQLIARFVYFLTFIVSFYLLSELLLSLKFNVANIIVFAFFTSLVAATGVKVNNRSKEISLEEKKGTIFSFFVDIFGMPFVTIGKWIIAGLSKFNILVIAINLILELPFQFFIEFVENFRSFIKSKKEEVN